ncbi:hypothetical protein TrVGV298_006139 [Trichoderma virens]|nr:hypothetical protein TrVGV298_006139 [Trichoderma virens]
MTTPTMPHTQWRSSPDINMEGNMSLDLTETQGNTGNPRLLSDNTTSEHGLSGDQAFNHTMYERDDKSERFLTMPAREGSAEPARLAMIEPIHVGESPRDYVHRVALRHKYLTTKLEEHRDDDGRTPLHHKVVEGDEETAIALVDFGANINAKDNDSQTPLYLAITLDCQDILGRFLWDKQKYAHNVVPLDLTVVTRKQQWTLLHASVNADDEATTETLLEAKLSPNQPDCDQLTPLHIAVKNGSPSYDSFSFSSIVDALLDEGADPTLTTGAVPRGQRVMSKKNVVGQAIVVRKEGVMGKKSVMRKTKVTRGKTSNEERSTGKRSTAHCCAQNAVLVYPMSSLTMGPS